MSESTEVSWRAQEKSSRKFHPWHKADALVGCSLFWLPVSSFPLRSAEKAWITRLILEIKKKAAEKLQLRMEYFLQKRTLYPLLMDPFLRYNMEFNPLGGMCIRWNKPMARPLTPEDVQQIIESGEKFDADKFTNDYLFWFAMKQHELQLQHFFGFGGSQVLWLPPDPNLPKLPVLFPKKVLEDPRFKPLNYEASVELTASLADGFLPASKELFAKDKANELHLLGTPFFLPVFTAQDILTARGEQREAWLKFMPIYLAESPDDRGVVLFTKPEFDPLLVEILSKFDQEKFDYPNS